MKRRNIPFQVFLRGKHVDTVFYGVPATVDEVRRSLIDHDGYDPAIVVKLTKPVESPA